MGQNFDAIVLGAGAAGLLCAIEAGKRGKRVAILEGGEKAGKKILISGGGRCNFTNLHCRPENFLSANEHFAKSALARYTPADFIALVDKHGIAYHEKTLGQLFCDRAAGDITDMLEQECREAGVRIYLNSVCQEVRRGADFCVRTAQSEFHAATLVVATGGLSIPKMGATAFGYEVARQFGLRVVATRPGLVPLLFAPQDHARYCDLAGVSAEVIVRLDEDPEESDRSKARAIGKNVTFREKMLITHRGLSGPAILQISSYWNQPYAGEQASNSSGAIRIDLAPDRNVIAKVLETEFRGMTALRNAFQGILPKRFATRWLDLHEPPAWSNAALQEFERQVHGWAILPAGTEGYDKAEVTAGGVDTSELSSKTMESHKVPGLYFVGEVVDVTGHLGGFNFQWAWASGAAAGRAL
ncbi:MAG: NAD(P)/FAD-dependent oxidoreductase [Candidatus Acidiferrum sp.]|jgi:predicted Rossmann fold flavoprotein